MADTTRKYRQAVHQARKDLEALRVRGQEKFEEASHLAHTMFVDFQVSLASIISL
jgi:hypothetical protein